jgi:hypothetical protein
VFANLSSALRDCSFVLAPLKLASGSRKSWMTEYGLVQINDLTDDFLSGFNMEVYGVPQIRLPVLTSEYFLTRKPHSKTSTLSIRLPLATANTAPTIHPDYRAAKAT